MNWTEIEKKYSKAFELACVYFRHDISKLDNEFDFTERDLYDFFDEQGIMCYIEFDVNQQIWFWMIVEKQYDGKWSGGGVGGGEPEERKKAEKYGFLKAFEILEDKLN